MQARWRACSHNCTVVPLTQMSGLTHSETLEETLSWAHGAASPYLGGSAQIAKQYGPIPWRRILPAGWQGPRRRLCAGDNDSPCKHHKQSGRHQHCQRAVRHRRLRSNWLWAETLFSSWFPYLSTPSTSLRWWLNIPLTPHGSCCPRFAANLSFIPETSSRTFAHSSEQPTAACVLFVFQGFYILFPRKH